LVQIKKISFSINWKWFIYSKKEKMLKLVFILFLFSHEFEARYTIALLWAEQKKGQKERRLGPTRMNLFFYFVTNINTVGSQLNFFLFFPSPFRLFSILFSLVICILHFKLFLQSSDDDNRYITRKMSKY
jgi:hypothetical protein